MKKLLIILVMLSIIGIGYLGAETIEKAGSSIKQAERSIEIANQVIPLKDKFNSYIRVLVEEAGQSIAEQKELMIQRTIPEPTFRQLKPSKPQIKALKSIKIW